MGGPKVLQHLADGAFDVVIGGREAAFVLEEGIRRWLFVGHRKNGVAQPELIPRLARDVEFLINVVLAGLGDPIP